MEPKTRSNHPSSTPKLPPPLVIMTQAIEDERTALQSIYGENFAVISTSEYSLAIDLKTRKLRTLLVSIYLSVAYPTTVPIVNFSPSSLPSARTALLLKKLTELCNGEPNLFNWIEWVRENAVDILLDEADRKTILSADDSCSEGSDDESPLESSNEDDQRALRGGGRKAHAQTVEVKDDYTGPAINHGIALTDRKSKFIAHTARVRSQDELGAVITNIENNRKWSTATHNTWAARIRMLDGSLDERSNDDGENGAGRNLLQLLQNMAAENVVIIVSRWFGGVMLGSDRFRHITTCAQELLSEMGYGRQVVVADEPKEKVRLRPAEDVLHRIKWDPDRKAEEYSIGYEDRFEGVLEMPFVEFDVQTDIPMHRIRFYKHNGVVVWDRRTKLDHFFTKA